MIKNDNSPRNDYLIVHKSVLPDFYKHVIEARDLIEFHGISISDACKKLNMSRSTYYKYKDLVFMPTSDFGKKIIISLKMMNVKGTLSSVLQFIASKSGNVLSIHQESIIRGYAFGTMLIDIIDLQDNLEDFITSIKKIKNIVDVELLAVE